MKSPRPLIEVPGPTIVSKEPIRPRLICFVEKLLPVAAELRLFTPSPTVMSESFNVRQNLVTDAKGIVARGARGRMTCCKNKATKPNSPFACRASVPGIEGVATFDFSYI